ncbi:ATP-dependent DNA helicase Q-like 4A isoform X2 [Daucus carota subsp. sativus]|uniref:ATP-dependent DNA helicase Q-like 4A isoform X2 n=1 Tax=Daucus carota subsp. sativus TaxID=79200 RepID=UPI0007F0346D|nr:PREDICTED: ATP-dependent DNA helicase Q-like 4A isoform X2 [Daucus carota subsp. sativus]
MVNGNLMSKKHSTGGAIPGEKCPKHNWSQHADAHANFSNQNKHLRTNFLYSLSTHKPHIEGEMAARSITCQLHNIEGVNSAQVEKACQAISRIKLSSNKYIKPGRSSPLVKDVGTIPLGDATRKIPQNLGGANGNFLGQMPPYISSNDSNTTPDKPKGMASSYPSGINGIAEAGKVACRQSNGQAPIHNHSHPNVTDGLYNQSTHASTVNGFQKHFPDDIDDDDILGSLDVDKIVMEHYQSSGTPQPLMSKLPSITPTGSKDNNTRPEESCLPPELCVNCSHGFKLGLCYEAAKHLQSMKDMLISISNDLLDNITDLNSEQIGKLHQDRAQLKKQIQQLEKHLHTTSVEEERRKSQFSASTASSRTIYSETPSAAAFHIDPMRLDTQFHMRNEPDGFDRWNSSYGVPPTPVEREPYIPKYIDVNYIEGSNDKKWSSLSFPWTKKLEVNNKTIFGNHSFRPNQREVINATMSGHDVFVLMPTGGGKSLTYQLPAYICPGITLVISPLVSLIQDQIMHLSQANIPATYLSANMEWTEQQDIFRELCLDSCRYKLLYVTPEKVAKSDVLLRHLEKLYSRQLLARIVIDEAHCVSQWGHDFRPDYQGLGILKQKFPDTPVLALTATATSSVKEDVVQALGLVDCIIFRQSFNRPNLQYSVMPKTKKCVEDIDSFIKKFHRDDCGIIYCLSKMDCEKVAEKLKEYGHKAAFYHGGVDPSERAYVQEQWSKDEINIICATVAFGMGINKPDVRFVIHHSLPKSIEGYHQECGRAGRDGQLSSCVLYYNYSDYIRVKHMLSQGASEQSSFSSGYSRTSTTNHGRVLETNTENLLRMVSYCENDVDCRRLLQLVHFGEKFDSGRCGKTCDNCSKVQSFIEKDCTLIAKQLVELVKLVRQQFSAAHILEVYRGSLNQFVKKHRHDSLSLHGAGKHLAKGEASRVLRYLVTEDFLFEDVKKSDAYGSVSSVVKVNESKVYNLCAGGQTIKLRFPTSTKSSKSGKNDATPAKALLTSGKNSLPLGDSSAQSQAESGISAKLYPALRQLRTALINEAGQNVFAHHIYNNATLQQMCKKIPRSKEELLEINGMGEVKVARYGDLLLQTIEATINEHNKTTKISSSSNESTDSGKRRRNRSNNSNENMSNDDVIDSTGRSKKRALSRPNQPVNIIDYEELADSDLIECVEFMESNIDIENDGSRSNQNSGGRVLPSWSRTAGN